MSLYDNAYSDITKYYNISPVWYVINCSILKKKKNIYQTLINHQHKCPKTVPWLLFIKVYVILVMSASVIGSVTFCLVSFFMFAVR